MTRDEVLIEFHEPYDVEIVPGLRRGGMQLNTEAMADEIVRLRDALDAARFFAAGWRREAYILNQCWTESIEDVNEVMDNLPYYYHQHLYGVDPALLNTKRKKPHA